MADQYKKSGLSVALILATILPIGLVAIQLDQSSTHAQEVVQATAQKPVEQEKVAAAVDVSQAFREVAKTMRPSVVSISSTTRARQTRSNARQFQGQIPPELRPFFDDENLERFFEFNVPQQEDSERHGLGSGVIVREDGYILTNHHVVRGADEVDVHLADGRKLPAEIVGGDRATDIAVLKIDANGLTPAKLGKSTELEVGEWVLAIGSPFGLEQTVTAGIVSATGRANMGITDYEDFVQTDAAINPGNSGGPLVNLRGEVIGINTAIASRSGGYMGVGFAIPSEMAGHVMQSIIDQGHVTRGWLGAMIQDLSEEMADSFNYDSTDGVLIGDVMKDGPAAKAGLQAGDIVIELNGSKVESANELRNMVASTAPGTDANLVVFRGGEQINLTVKIEQLNTEKVALATGRTEQNEEVSDLGVTVETLTPQLASQLGADDNLSGIVVTQVEPGSLANRIGLQQGDIIVALGEESMDNVTKFKEATRDLNLEEGVRLQIVRGGIKRFVFIKSQ